MKFAIVLGFLFLGGCAHRIAYTPTNDKGMQCKHECQMADQTCEKYPRHCLNAYNRCMQGCADMYK